jgi:predicted nucleic acid-binding protein
LIGIDTDFLIAFEDNTHAKHAWARSLLASVRVDGRVIAIAPQVASEYAHVVTDARRFETPLSMEQAIRKLEEWRTATEVRWFSPDEKSIDLFFSWMLRFRLGRKRVLDTMLASAYAVAGVNQLATLNKSDFEIFGVFTFPDMA